MPSVLSTLKRRRDLNKEKKTLSDAKPEIVVTTETNELDALRDESADIARDNKRQKLINDQVQAIEDSAFVERLKLDPKCIYALHGNFTKLCQKDIPVEYGAALLCPFHNSKCTPGVKDSVLKKAYAKYRYGKKDQQTAFAALATLRLEAQGAVAAVDNAVNGMSNLNVKQDPEPIQQEFKREHVFDFKVEHPKITGEALDAMSEHIQADAKEMRKHAKDYVNMTKDRSLNAIVDPHDIAVGVLKEIVDLDNKLPADQVLPAIRKYVTDMRADRKRKADRDRRAPVQPPRPAGVKAQ